MPDVPEVRAPFPAEDEIVQNQIARRHQQRINDAAVEEYQRLFGNITLSPIESHNAMVLIIKNLTKWRDDPMSDDEILKSATNPTGRLFRGIKFKSRPPVGETI